MPVTIREAADALRKRQFSSVELTTAALGRIGRLNPALRAFITVTAEAALKKAAQADEELARGRDRGPLHGIPIAREGPLLHARASAPRPARCSTGTLCRITTRRWWSGWSGRAP